MKLKLLLPLSLCLLAGGGYFVWQGSQSSEKPVEPVQHDGAESKTKRDPLSQQSPFSFLLTSSAAYDERLEPLRSLRSEDLTERDRDFLYAALSHHDPIHSEAWWVVLNEIMDRLGRIEDNPQRYTAGMLALLQNPEINPVAKDYAIQHLGSYYSPNRESNGRTPATPEETMEVLQVFTDTITNPDLAQTSVPGTGVTVIASMKKAGLEEETLAPIVEQLTPWFAETVSGVQEVPLATRVTAINIAGELNIESLKPTIRDYVTTEKINATIRLNSIAALGTFGDESDLAELEKIANSSRKFRFAAQSALKNLQNKVNKL